jgi:hypothetical protein
VTTTKEALAAEAKTFQRRNRLFYWAATVVMAVLVLFIALQIFVQVRAGGGTTRAAMILALSWAPTVFYLWGLLAVRGMFAALSRKGFIFHEAVSSALMQLGASLLLGALAALAALPFLISLGSRVLGQFAIFTAPALTIGVVGLVLIAVAGMMRRAAHLEAKAVSLRAVLDDFI